MVAVLRSEPGRRFRPAELKRQTRVPKALALRLLGGIPGVHVVDGRAVCVDPARIPPDYEPAPDDALVPVECRSVKFVVPVPGRRVRRQLQRILASLREFPFQPSRHWQVLKGETFEEGWSPRVPGDPIYDTLQQAAGVFASRAEVEEAVAAIVLARQPDLPPRCAPLLTAAVEVAAALARKRRVMQVDGVTIRIHGPWLPP